MSNDMTKQMLAVFAVGLLVAVAPAADTWYWTGLVNEPIQGQTDVNTWGLNANNAGNWTNLVTHTTGVPQAGDTVVYSSDYASNANVGFNKIASRKLAEIRCEKGSFF